MSSLRETDATLEAKVATIMEPYKKAGIKTENCTLQGILEYFILTTEFEKINKILHHFIREEIFPQLMSQAYNKGIISRASILNPDDMYKLSTWLRTKEGQAAIKDEFDIRKLKRKAAKRFHKETGVVWEEVPKKVTDEDDVAQNVVKRARMLEPRLRLKSS